MKVSMIVINWLRVPIEERDLNGTINNPMCEVFPKGSRNHQGFFVIWCFSKGWIKVKADNYAYIDICNCCSHFLMSNYISAGGCFFQRYNRAGCLAWYYWCWRCWYFQWGHIGDDYHYHSHIEHFYKLDNRRSTIPQRGVHPRTQHDKW